MAPPGATAARPEPLPPVAPGMWPLQDATAEAQGRAKGVVETVKDNAKVDSERGGQGWRVACAGALLR